MSTWENKRILVVGMGNMATALFKGVIASGLVQPKHVYAVVHGETSKKNAEALGVNLVCDVEALDVDIDVVFVAVKPQMMGDVLPLYKKWADNGCLFVSVAAGFLVSSIRHYLGENAQVVRAMPNTPCEIGAGISGIYLESGKTLYDKSFLGAFFEASGEVIYVDSEDQLNLVTALSGSGPAYFFYVIEALAEAAMEHGMSEPNSYKLAIETCKGAGMYASMCHLSTSVPNLRKNVTSPGGTTEAGLKVLNTHNSKAVFFQVVEKSYKKAKNLSLSYK